MSQSIQLTIEGDQVKVISPYNADFVAKCRNFRGKFKNGAWWFDDSIIDYVREAMIEFYGTTGEVPFDNCILLVKDFTEYGSCAPVVLFGRTIAKAFGRDSGARLGEDIIFISGEYESSGSAKNWTTRVANATFEIHNFPVPSLDLPEVKAAIEAGWCKVKKSKKRRPTAEIEAEINLLKVRVKELETELNETL